MLKFFRSINNFLSPLKTKSHSPLLDHTYDPKSAMGSIMNSYNSAIASIAPGITVTEEQHRRNIEKIELARLEQDRESINNNLAAQHRVMIITLIATFVALFSSVSAIFITTRKDQPEPPVVNVSPSQPDIKIYPPEPKPEERPSQPQQ